MGRQGKNESNLRGKRGYWKLKYSIVLYGELALEEVTDPSKNRLWNKIYIST
jgi:hypothetical protein